MKGEILSRRDFLRKAGIGILAAAEAGAIGIAGNETVGKVSRYSVDWNISAKENDQFLEENKKYLENLTYGASFAPEMFGVSLDDIGEDDGRQDDALMCLDNFMMQDLGIKDIRFGIRWENVERQLEDGSTEIDLTFYKPYLDRMIERGANVTLDIGYKSQRWPETHAPTHWERAEIFPADGADISASMPFASEAILPYVANLCDTVQKKYGNKINSFQIENEPFLVFGENDHTIDEDIIQSEVDIVVDRFPDASIVLNTGAGHEESIDLISGKVIPNIIKKHPELRNKITMGLDFHYAKPEKYALFKTFDQIIRNKLMPPSFGKIYDEIRDRSKKYGFNLAVMEAQMEEWGGVTDAIDSVRHFRFMNLRVAKNLVNYDEKYYSFLWGMEKLWMMNKPKSIEAEHDKIKDFIRKINKQAA